MKLAIILSVVLPTMVYLTIRWIQVSDFTFKKKNKSDKTERDIFDFDFIYSSPNHIFKWNNIEIKCNVNWSSWFELYKSLKEIKEKRPELFKEMYYTLDNMIHHLKYIYEEDYDNFVNEIYKHIDELLKPIIRKIRKEDKLAEEELQIEKQKIIDKEKEDYDFKFNACKELWLDKIELGSSELTKTKIAKNSLNDEIKIHLDKVNESIVENYYNNTFNMYSNITNNANEKINLLNKLKNEKRQQKNELMTLKNHLYFKFGINWKDKIEFDD